MANYYSTAYGMGSGGGSEEDRPEDSMNFASRAPMNQNVSAENMPAQQNMSGDDVAAPAVAGAAATGNPYAMAGSFLVSYLNNRAQQFQKKKEAQMAAIQNYGNAQDKALDSLNNTWKSALLK